jgi:hypothetical protein
MIDQDLADYPPGGRLATAAPGSPPSSWLEEYDWDPAEHDWDPEQDDGDADGWLAVLAAGGQAQFGDAGWTGEGESIAAGFLHHDDGPAGVGFASGGVLDRLEPGPALARMTALATRDGHRELGESELIGVLCAWRRMSSWAAAGEAAAVITLMRRRYAQARERGNRHLSEHVAEEVAAALTLTGRSASLLTDDAAELARLPEVLQHLSEGHLDWAKACVFARELCVAGEHDARAIAGQVLPGARLMTTGQIRNALRRLILALDPEAATRRKDAGAKDAEVCVWSEVSGNAALAGRELPEADVISADRRLTALARWLANHGAQGSLGQLRAAVFSALLNGRPVQSLLPAGPAVAATADPDAAPDGWPQITGTVHLTIPLATWAGTSQTPGEIAGYGPADARTCRGLARSLAASPATRWCLTGTGEREQAVAHACATRVHGPPPPGPAALAWARALAGCMKVLETGTCGHSLQEDRYQPSQSLRHLIRVRQPQCSFPGCRRPAAGTDLDHTIPYEQGGRTCSCNLAPLCRRHHQTKQAPGWQLTQPAPGVMDWRAPSGRAYQRVPDAYPV